MRRTTRVRPRALGIVATVGLVVGMVALRAGAASAALPVVDDFQTGLPSGTDSNGVGIGFLTFNDPNSAVAISTTTTPPAPAPGTPDPNTVLKMDLSVVSFAGFSHRFENPAVDTWVSQDWSAYEGISLWLYGNNSGTTMFFDVLDNRTPGSTKDDAERWSIDIPDNYSGWKEIKIPFTSLQRKEIGNGAPNDGLGLTQVHGWSLGTVTTPSPQTYYIDNVTVYGVAPNLPPTVGAGGPYSVNEGGSVPMTATGSDPDGDPLTFAWDLDANGTFETPGQSVTFSASGLDGPSSHKAEAQATDPSGLSAVASATVNVVNVPPTVAIPTISPEPSTEGSGVTAGATFNDPGPDAPFTCTVDYGDGSGSLPGTVAGNTCTGPGHTYSTFGEYAVTVTVTDKDGGTGSNSTTHVVIFNFSGFFQPVDNLPTFNVVKAGQAIPVKFSLGGDKGLSIFAPGYPKSEPIACSSNAASDGVEETVTAGGSSLSYDLAADYYNYVWKTNKAWANTCRQLVIKFIDGTHQRANFRLTG